MPLKSDFFFTFLSVHFPFTFHSFPNWWSSSIQKKKKKKSIRYPISSPTEPPEDVEEPPLPVPEPRKDGKEPPIALVKEPEFEPDPSDVLASRPPAPDVPLACHSTKKAPTTAGGENWVDAFQADRVTLARNVWI